MGRYSILFCFTFVICALINTGTAIRCYKCSGTPTDDCGSPEEHSHLIVNCTEPNHNACITETITVLNQTTGLIRGCGDRNSCDSKRSDLHDEVCSAIFICTYIQYANSIRCYSCISSSPNQTCFTPLNTTKIPSYVCNKTSSNFNDFLNTTHLNPHYVEEALNSSEFECVMFKKHYVQGNITEVGRGCFPRTSYVNACQALYLVAGNNTSHHLKDCDVCHYNNCNSASSILPASTFLFLAFIVLRTYLK
ncbi:hypothetical protein RN001_013403 [Aquatica leii]|uniref:Sodefrin-like factor n=1 Tax=Aquatica leii TaxID=1421715 RepID=A0AAN7P2S4_9COLE|nr:hypothetical protein RN001_013403 [Aquatica leii]